jgi:hypothetical protein
MPTYTKRRKSTRRRFRTKRRPRINIKKEIKKYLDGQTETKSMDETASISVSNSGSAIVQPLPVKGINSYDRIGDMINLVSHFIRLRMTFPAVSPDTNNTIRFIFMVDRMNRGGTISLADVLQDMVHPLTTPLNKSFAGRFYIIIDKLLKITANEPMTDRKFYIKVKKYKKQEFITNTGTITDIREFAYYMIAVSDSSAVGHPVLEYYYRMSYKDC